MIRLDSKYAIKSDGTQYILGVPTKSTDKAGKEIETWSDCKYLPTMEMALTVYIRIRQKKFVEDTENLTIKECIKGFENINEEIKELLKGVRNSEMY